jgi:hypothetical protein
VKALLAQGDVDQSGRHGIQSDESNMFVASLAMMMA